MGQDSEARPRVGILMGSDSDYAVMEAAVAVCRRFEVPCEARVLSAHRTPGDVAEYARTARDRGLGVIIAGAGMAAHLAGAVAAWTTLPVVGVPVRGRQLDGLDALLATVMMPPGVPVATVAIDGARNAGLLAIQILATGDAALAQALADEKLAMAEASRSKRVG